MSTAPARRRWPISPIWLVAAIAIVALIAYRFFSAPELGEVDWLRDYDAAVEQSRATGRPIAMLFQEVPGCPVCVAFGDGPLSDPALVRALQELFVPVAILNNLPGDDAAVCARFGEPTWNNPVMRFVDADGRDLVPRREFVLKTPALAARMVDALRAAARSTPSWLTAVAGDA